MLSTPQLRLAWGPLCTSYSALSQFTFWNGTKILVRSSTLPAWVALNSCLKKWDYGPRQIDTGAYNCRPITGGTNLSLHSFGIATDINWLTNPYGPVLKTDMPPEMVAAIKAIRTNDGLQVFRWGGNYIVNKDAMHYEVAISPVELAAGIDWATVAKPPVAEVGFLATVSQESWDLTVYKVDSTWRAVGRLELSEFEDDQQMAALPALVAAAVVDIIGADADLADIEAAVSGVLAELSLQ